MSLFIITDSASDVVDKSREDLIVLPLKVRFDDGNEYLDGVNITHQEFYEKLIESDALPTTSQINPFDFTECFNKIKEAGDEAIVMTLSAKLSGTYQSACIAADDFEDCITVVDTNNATMGELTLVDYALRLKDEGKTRSEIVEIIETEKNDIQLIGLVDTLEYLKKGGRISATVALAGGMLAIKPVVALEDGVIVMKGKARGSKNAENLFITTINASGGIDFSKPYRVGYTGLSDHLVKKYIEDSSSMWDKYVDDIPYQTIGGTIGTHVGPGAVAAAFFPKHPERLQNLTKNS